jgi:hypothetical protein
MVRLRINQIMKARHISAYALSKGTNLSYPSAYRLSRSGGVFGRLHAETLDALCGFFTSSPASSSSGFLRHSVTPVPGVCPVLRKPPPNSG